MDCEAISQTPEHVLEKLGLKKGDVYALKGMCTSSISDSSKCNNDPLEVRKRRLVEELMSGRQDRQGKERKKEIYKKRANPSSQPKLRRVSLGWMHFNSTRKKYVSVRASKGGGTRTLDLPQNTTIDEVIEKGKKLFYENGHSIEGKSSEMQFELVNFKGETIKNLKDEEGKEVPFTIQGYFEAYKLSRVFLYLASKRAPISDISDDEVSELSDSELENSAFAVANKGRFWRANLNAALEEKYSINVDDDDIQCIPKTTLIGNSEERTKLKDEQDNAFKLSLEADQKKERDRIDSLRQEITEVQRLEDLRSAREKRVPPQLQTDSVRITVLHSSIGRMTRFFGKEEKMSAAYDWIGSQNIHPEVFALLSTQVDSIRHTKVLFSESVAAYHDCVLRMDPDAEPESEDGEVYIKGFGKIIEDNDDTLHLDDISFLVAPIEEKPPSQIMEHDRYYVLYHYHYYYCYYCCY